MNKMIERAKMVLAMETICRHLGDEEILMSWLISGVADGDINENTTPQDIINMEYYCDDETFQELMECFLRKMKAAIRSGGLYCDGICTRDGEI